MEREFKIPEGFKVTVDGKKLRVEYGGRFIEKQINYPSSIKLKVEDNKLIVSSEIERRKIKAMMGTLIAHVRNMVKGLKDGYTYRLKAVYTHFPMTIKVEGDEVIITNFLGERTVRKAKILGD
ncbi:MAG: 50S ribosomal protein L6, partial [Candidatus Aenigmarchaeota archaeon]|nr:50S ribosomal protein L6 [Candidatus Aenigmarchaeota archaeon]